MREVIIRSQKEYNELETKREYTRIVVKSSERIHVVALENSHVEAWGNSHVVAWGNSHVVAWENSHVVAWENSHVEALGNSHVEAWGNSHVVALGNSHVVAWGNSHVVAWGNSMINVFSCAELLLYGLCVAIASRAVIKKIKKKSKHAVIQEKIELDWFEENGIEIRKNQKNIVLYKKVSFDFKTQENTRNETLWAVKSTIVHPNWNPSELECGEGKFHACSKPYFCDEFRGKKGDRYIALRVALEDLFIWEEAFFPHKIAFRKGKVLYECDRYGEKIDGDTAL